MARAEQFLSPGRAVPLPGASGQRARPARGQRPGAAGTGHAGLHPRGVLAMESLEPPNVIKGIWMSRWTGLLLCHIIDNQNGARNWYTSTGTHFHRNSPEVPQKLG